MRDFLGNQLVSADLEFARGILLLDDCSGTMTWTKAAMDVNGTLTYETAAAYMGLNGMQLYSGDADPAEDDVIRGTKVVERSESGLLVFRARYCGPDISLCKAVSLIVFESDGVKDYEATVSLAVATGVVTYKAVGPSFVAVPACALVPVDGQWFGMEVAVDCLSHEWLSVKVGGRKVEIPGVGLHEVGASTDKRVSLRLQMTVAGAAAATLYADSIYAGEFLEL